MASRKKRITEDSIFYQPKKASKQAPILLPSNISNFPALFKPYGKARATVKRPR